MKKYLELEDISAYRISFEVANYIWNIVMKWDYFTKDTVGKQLVRAVDSISANIAEGFGRYFKKDKVNFYHYSYGSISESLDWVKKAKIRNLLKDEDEKYIINVLDKLPKEINNLINFTNKNLAV